MGHVGRFVPAEPVQLPRGASVICRTARGLEVGEVLSLADRRSPNAAAYGQLLRRVTPEDQLLLERLERYREEAYDACTHLLRQRSVPATLVDVEHLFDGQSVFFYFLGETNPELNALTDELAATYEKKVQFDRFAETLAEGCGPDCGTAAASGCGDSCATCAVAQACR